MPKTSGSELSQMLTSLRPGLQTLYMTGYTDDSAVRHGIGDTEGSVLQKPFALESLASKLRAILD